MCSSQPSRIKPQRPLKKFPAKFKIKPRRPLRKSQKILQPSSRSKLWKVNKRNKIRADSPTTKAKDHLPHKAPCGPISTFKIKPRRPLKKFQTKVQEQASTALEEISSPIQDQASTALEEISNPIQDQASTTLGSTSTVRDFTHLLHATSTCTRRDLKWGHL
ncbi:hypothetical protein ACFXTO_038235 [Malus domestica]